MKLLLYCTKSKPYLFDFILDQYPNRYGLYDTKKDCDSGEEALNGKIVAECDFEIEEIRNTKHGGKTWYYLTEYPNNPYIKRTCLTEKQLDDYLKGNIGYAIHIKNLHIFNEPKELYVYRQFIKGKEESAYVDIKKAPQNMMYACGDYQLNEEYVLISVRPEWLCKILNGEKTIEVRKKILKEMKNDK